MKVTRACLLILSLELVYAALSTIKLMECSREASWTREALKAVLEAAPQEDSFLLIITEGKTQFDSLGDQQAPLGVGVFEVEDLQDVNNVEWEKQLKTMVTQARRLQMASRFVTVVVASDDPTNLADILEQSERGRLLLVSARLIVITHLPLSQVHHIRRTLAVTNSVLVLLSRRPTIRGTVYVEFPYTTEGALPKRVGTWTPQKGFTLTSNLPVFPEKFEKLSNAPEIKVTYVEYSSTKKELIDNPDTPGGKKLIILDHEMRLFELVAESMNFKLDINSPPDQAWGIEMPNGSYTGMMGMLQRKEVDISVSLLHATYERNQVVDFTFPLTVWYSRILVHRGLPVVDPWAFLQPITALVYGCILMAVLLLMTLMVVLPKCLPDKTLPRAKLFQKTFNYIRVLLQEDVASVRKWWWWERVLLGVWMLMMLVLTQSYAGNLMSLLAVRYIPLPIQYLQDVLTHPVTVLTPTGTNVAHAFLDAEEGILRQVGDLQQQGRFKTIYISEMNTYLDKRVRRGTHVIVLIDSRTTAMVANDFSVKGRCEFYLAQEEIIPMMASFAFAKDSPLFPAFNIRIMRLVESGIYHYWLQMYTPNYTSCLYPPKKVAVRTSLGISNLWGMMVLVAGGAIISLLIFCLELLCYPILH